MTLTYGNQTIDLFCAKYFPDGYPAKVVLSLSGGCDSSSLFYLLAKHFPNMEIVPFNCRDEDSPLDTDSAIRIASFIKKEFPDNPIHDLKIYDVKTTDPLWLQAAKEAREDPSGKIMRNGKLVYKWRTIKGTSKALQNRMIRHLLRDKYETVVITALTGNPPVEEMKALNFYDVSERRRDLGVSDEPLLDRSGTYAPYLNVDKKFVAGIYFNNGLMESLYPMTRSCAWGPLDGNDRYPDPCGKCFWCHEKKWAFDSDRFE